MINFNELFLDIPPQLATMLTAMIPIGENRASIPIALGVYKMSVISAFFWSALGTIIIAVILVLTLDKIEKLVKGRMGVVDKTLEWFFARTEKKFTKKYEKWGELALLLFVAVPLPVTGVWTGAAAAFLFGIKPKRALLFISGGVIISAVIVTLISLGVISFI